MESLEYLKGELERHEELIRDKTGIELTWAEKAGLRMYIREFNYQNSLGTQKGGVDIIHYFMLDYFGIDWLAMDYKNVCMVNNMGKDIRICFGMNFLGAPEFKEYCRNHVQQWREESELGNN